MHEFTVDGMTCGHCASRIEKAVRSVDSQASVKIDIPTRKVVVGSKAGDADLRKAIEDAGYPVVSARTSG